MTDFEGLLKALSDNDVEIILVGGLAARAHGATGEPMRGSEMRAASGASRPGNPAIRLRLPSREIGSSPR